jgi:23S rRNA (cytidine1920-2'-O)/16S rRNA (cytidine1409-2'-O)-methyltransferase
VTTRRRLDAELVRRQLVDSRADAARLVAAKRVLVNGAVADKVARQVADADAVVIEGPPARFVSRGGEKLDAALDAFDIAVIGRRALDAGASTGGFTDCLLQRGAAEVVAVDVGHGQLHPKLRDNPRVDVREHFHVRDLTRDAIGGAVDMVVADLSFISLVGVLSPMIACCNPEGDIVLLVKPQFEAGRREVSRGRGVLTDPTVHEAACQKVEQGLVERGCVLRGRMPSPLLGGHGNTEFLVWANAPSGEVGHG